MDGPLKGAQGEASAHAAPTLRQAAIDAIDNQVRWVPPTGRDRIFNMVANRPDWCISRQRAWGVPIPAVDCTTCGEALLTPALVERAAAVFDTYGADAWYERPIEEFLPDGLTCPACGGTDVRARARHPRRLVRLRLEPRGGPAVPAGADAGRPTSTSRAATSTAAGSRARSSSASARAAVRRSRRSSRTASSSPKTARRCRSRSATRSSRRTSSRRAAPRSSGCGWRWSTTARKCGSASRSSRAWSRRTARSGTRCGTCVVEPVRLRPGDRSRAARPRCRRSIATRSRATRTIARDGARCVRELRLPDDLPARQPAGDGGSHRVLRRRLEGSALHVRGGVAGAALGADGDVRDRRRARPPAGADPADDGRRAVAAPARERGTCPSTSPSSRQQTRSRRCSTPTSSTAGSVS